MTFISKRLSPLLTRDKEEFGNMINFICEQGGVQVAAASEPPERCPVCEDEREFVNWAGQSSTTLEGLRATHRNSLAFEGSGVLGIGTEPHLAIRQRALLLRTAEGNVLWERVEVGLREAFRVRRIHRKLTRRRASGSLRRITVFVTYENVVRLLEFLGYSLK